MTQNRELRVAVVGLGPVGQRRAWLYAEDPRTQLVAVVDRDAKQAGTVAERVGADAAYRSITDLELRRSELELDVLDVCDDDWLPGQALLDAFPPPIELVVSAAQARAALQQPLRRSMRPRVHVAGYGAHYAHVPEVKELTSAALQAWLSTAVGVLRMDVTVHGAHGSLAAKGLLSPVLDLLADVTGRPWPLLVARQMTPTDGSFFEARLAYDDRRGFDGGDTSVELSMRTGERLHPGVTWDVVLPGERRFGLDVAMDPGSFHARDVDCAVTCMTSAPAGGAHRATQRRVRTAVTWSHLQESLATRGAWVGLPDPPMVAPNPMTPANAGGPELGRSGPTKEDA